MKVETLQCYCIAAMQRLYRSGDFAITLPQAHFHRPFPPFCTKIPGMTFGALVFADISGYTRFSRLHLTSLLHAEAIISELLEAIIQAAAFPLQVGQLEGDAVLMYAAVPTGREADAARDIAQQIHQLFLAFAAREHALITCDAGCVCSACNEIELLKLKALLHFGEFTLQTLQGIAEITGPGVSVLRALAKAPVAVREYVLLTEPFHLLSGAWHNRPPDEQIALPVGETTLHAQVYYPQVPTPSGPPRPGEALAFSGLLNRHSFARMLGQKPRATFHHLRAGPMNLVLYLLEGIVSGLNVLRKFLQNSLRPKPAPPTSVAASMVVRPTVLMLLQITQTPTAVAQPPFSVQLLQAGLAVVQPPLTLNKLEGDAALLYASIETDSQTIARDVLRQAQAIYQTYCARQQAWANLLTPTLNLHFKIILHYGDVAFKQIQHFNEIAGPEVILLHRLLKNTVADPAYILMTDAFYHLIGGPTTLAAEARTEVAESIGPVAVQVAALSLMKFDIQNRQ